MKNVDETQQWIKSTAQNSLVAKNIERFFHKKPLLPLLLVLSTMLYNVIHPTSDIYSIFGYKPM